MIILAILFYALAAFFALGVIGGPFLIGKPRKPWTAGQVVFSTLTGVATIAGLLIAGVATLNGFLG